MADWMSKWQRSPRQDRRVLVNGKFVELTEPILPEVKEEPAESALEIVQEPVESAPSVTTEDLDVDKEFHILPMPPIPEEVWQFINAAQTANETATRTVVSSTVLSESIQDTAGEDVLDGQAGRVKEIVETPVEPIDAVAEHIKGSLTVADIAKAVLPEDLPF